MVEGKPTLDTQKGAWSWTYNSDKDGERAVTGRLGKGSGSTPSLMGTGNGDKLMVITTGEQPMRLLFIWRDKIPHDFKAGLSEEQRRLAGEVVVDFGQNNQRAISEQSVLVSDYSAAVVSNDYRLRIPGFFKYFPTLQRLFSSAAVLLSNVPGIRPWGVSKYSWDSATRQVKTDWINPQISCPNGVPTMSRASSTFYCVGQIRGRWGINALDWQTGKLKFQWPVSYLPRYNSAYAATQVGPEGTIISGTASGVMVLRDRE